jgi:hypothetical protein
VAVAGYQFTIVDGPLDAERAAIEKLIILLFLRDYVQHDAFLRHMIERHPPLI